MSEEGMQKIPFKENKILLPVGTVVIVVSVTLIVGFLLGFGYVAHGNDNNLLSENPPEGVDFAPVWKAWRMIDEKFVPASVATSTQNGTSTDPTQKRVWGMIGGLANSLDDPYTFFLPPKENEIFEEDISGEFQGVGMEIAVRDEVLTVVSPLKDTPAERAGLKSGDKILEIDDEETRGLDISTAVSKIRGPKGTQVVLLVMREGFTEPREYKVTRDVINFPIVTTTEREDGVFVIELASFTANSPGLFRDALREFVQTGGRDLVLDLRGNPGGYLDAAVEMASWFLPSGRVVVTEDYAGHAGNIAHRSRGYNIFNENLRMVILVDKGSASASEILAGALRHYSIATLVGDYTFGKGSVQELIDITGDTSLKLTVARWLTPGEDPIPLDGIKPDIEVEITEEDVTAGEDPQFEAALKALKDQ